MEKRNIAISIVVPMYNVEKYIDECITSLLNQSIEKEIILIDDGSTDLTFLIAQKYAKQHECIKLIHQENAGQSSARNKGVSVASGQYVLFCDSDDCIDAECLPRLFKLCEENDLDILKAGWKTMDGKKCSLNIPPKDSVRLYTVMTARELFVETIYNWYNVVPFDGLFKLEFLRENHIVFPEGIQFEDNLYHLMASLIDVNARVMQVDEPFYTVHISEGSTTTEKPGPKKVYDQLENVRLMNRFIEQKITDPDLKELAKVAVSSLVFTMTSYYYRVDKKYRKELSKAIPKEVLLDAIKHPQSQFQYFKLLFFTYVRPLLDIYEIYRMYKFYKR